MTLKRKIFISGAIIYFILLGVLWRQPLARLFITDLGGGYYFSRQFDSEFSWVNTGNLDKLGGKLTSTARGLRYAFKKSPGDRVIIKVLYGLPFKTHHIKEDNFFTKAVIASDNFSRELPSRIGYVPFGDDKLMQDGESFNLVLKRGTDPLQVRRIEVSVLPPRRDFLPNLPLLGFLLVLPFLSVAIARNRRNGLIWLVLFLMLFLGANLRWQEIERVSFAPPHPDAGHASNTGYRFKADNMKLFTEKGFYAAGKRNLDIHEPFYPLLAKGVLGFFGSSDLHLRFISFFFGLLALFLTFLVARRLLSSDLLGLIPVGMMSVSSILIEQASYGLRTEFETCLFLLLFYVGYMRKEELKRITRSVYCMVIGAVWMLTRSFSLPITLFIVMLGLAKDNLRLLRKLAVFCLIAALIIIPYIPYKINIYKAHGTFSWDSNQYATTHANFEFVGQEGFPKDEISMFDYFFKLHTMKQFVAYNLVGAAGVLALLNAELFGAVQKMTHVAKVIRYMGFGALADYGPDLLWVIFVNLICLAAVSSALFFRRMRLVLGLIMVATFYNLFLYGVTIIKNIGTFEMHRTIVHAQPFYSILVVHLVGRLLKARFGNFALRSN